MLKTISIGSYKQLQGVEINFNDTLSDPSPCILVGDALSGKREALEVIPFLFAHTPSFQDQAARYYNSGIVLHDKENMTATGVIDFTLGFRDNSIHSVFNYEGDEYYGAWIKQKKQTTDLLSESTQKAKLYSFTESSRISFSEPSSSYIKSSGEGLLSYIEYIAKRNTLKLGTTFKALMSVFPEITGVLVYPDGVEKLSVGKIELSNTQKQEPSVYFAMNNGMTYKFTHVPMAILASLASLIICMSEHSSNLILINEFDLHLDTDRSFKLFTELEAVSTANSKQLILSTSKREFLMKPNSHYIERSTN